MKFHPEEESASYLGYIVDNKLVVEQRCL